MVFICAYWHVQMALATAILRTAILRIIAIQVKIRASFMSMDIS